MYPPPPPPHQPHQTPHHHHHPPHHPPPHHPLQKNHVDIDNMIARACIIRSHFNIHMYLLVSYKQYF